MSRTPLDPDHPPTAPMTPMQDRAIGAFGDIGGSVAGVRGLVVGAVAPLVASHAASSPGAA